MTDNISMPLQIHDKLLLTGAAGALGQVLRLRLKANCKVLRLSDFNELGAATEGEEIVQADLGDAAAVDRAVAGVSAIVFVAAWLASRDALPGRDGRYTVSQGREVGYDARLQLRVDEAGNVWSGGHVRTIVTGQIDW